MKCHLQDFLLEKEVDYVSDKKSTFNMLIQDGQKYLGDEYLSRDFENIVNKRSIERFLYIITDFIGLTINHVLL